MLNAETLFQAATYAKKVSKDGRLVRIRLETMGMVVHASVMSKNVLKSVNRIIDYHAAEETTLDTLNFIRMEVDRAVEDLKHA